MMLVVDSGSTKADWIVVDQKAAMQKFTTAGFNPYFHNNAFIVNELNQNPGLSEIAANVKAIRFFGAGCSSAERNEVIKNSLGGFFTNATITVDSDMVGAVLSTCGDQPGIVGILGTGSNSCYYDGKNIQKNNFGLGFIMADEGGGSYFGKKLIANYLYGTLPAHLNKKFNEQYEMSKEIMIANVYNNPKANVWLASFAEFLTTNREEEWVISMAKKGMREFFDLYICSYKNVKETDVHFVGSIAYYFDEVIRNVAAEKNVNVKMIIRHPINHLAEYFLKNKTI